METALGTLLRDVRIALGASWHEVADTLGCNTDTYVSWEVGTLPPANILPLIAYALGIDRDAVWNALLADAPATISPPIPACEPPLPVETPPPAPAPESPAPRPGSVAERILTALQRGPATTAALAKSAGTPTPNHARVTLSRMLARGWIARTDDKRWTLATPPR